jgi:tungstate transport system permease protein
LQGIARDARDLALSLGANRLQLALAVIRQGRFAFLTALIAGFSRVIGETGMTLMVGGNIRGQTRVLTTAISLETMKGNFEFGIALGIVLLLAAMAINILLQWAQGK